MLYGYAIGLRMPSADANGPRAREPSCIASSTKDFVLGPRSLVHKLQWKRGMLFFNCSSHTLTGLIWMTGSLLAALGPASAQESTDLQQQLQQLKQQYEETAHDLQQRIATLEQQIQKQQDQQTQKEKESAEKAKEGTISAAELAVEGAAKTVAAGESNQVGANFQGKLSSEPTYDLLQEADQKIEKLEQQVGTFEFHGYFRSGYGLNSAGGQQVAFEAPGTEAKYRLGNEAETYGEFIFVNNWLNPDHASDKAWMKTEFMVEANTTNSTSYTSFPSGVGNDQLPLPGSIRRSRQCL